MEKSEASSEYDSLCSLSGGIDTTTLAYDLVRAGRHPLFVFVDYAHKARASELRCARATAATLKCDLLSLPFETYRALSDSYIFEGQEEFETGAQFWLEGRNVLIALFLAVIASKHRVREVYMGSHKPLAGWEHETYPDATDACYQAINKVIDVSFKWKPRIKNPFIDWDWDKSQIIRHGESLGVPWQDTFTCCEEGDLHCWSCEACQDRMQAFALSGVNDPCREDVISDSACIAQLA